MTVLCIDQARAILAGYGIRVFCSYPGAYSLRRDLPAYSDPQKCNVLREGLSVAHASLGDVRAMALAYDSLTLPRNYEMAQFCRQRLGDVWRVYTDARLKLEGLGVEAREGNGWALADDPPQAVAQLHAKGTERAYWHTHRVWQENTRARLSAIAAGEQ